MMLYVVQNHPENQKRHHRRRIMPKAGHPLGILWEWDWAFRRCYLSERKLNTAARDALVILMTITWFLVTGVQSTKTPVLEYSYGSSARQNRREGRGIPDRDIQVRFSSARRYWNWGG